MWKINDYILINHAIEGDILQWDSVIFELKYIEDNDKIFVVRGMEMNWDEDIEFEIPDCHIVPLMIWD